VDIVEFKKQVKIVCDLYRIKIRISQLAMAYKLKNGYIWIGGNSYQLEKGLPLLKKCIIRHMVRQKNIPT